jgi:hypothetical protein
MSNRLTHWFKYQANFRGTYLLILGILDIVYGLALLMGEEVGKAVWWPLTQGSMLGICMDGWGVIWITIGLFLLTGITRASDRWQFTAAIFLKVIWAVTALAWAVVNGNTLWGVAAIYIGFAAVTLLVAAWPDTAWIDKGDFEWDEKDSAEDDN